MAGTDTVERTSPADLSTLENEFGQAVTALNGAYKGIQNMSPNSDQYVLAQCQFAQANFLQIIARYLLIGQGVNVANAHVKGPGKGGWPDSSGR